MRDARDAPAVVVVGPVAALADEIGWRERGDRWPDGGGDAGPRPGQRIVRPAARAGRERVELPSIRIAPLPDGPGISDAARAWAHTGS